MDTFQDDKVKSAGVGTAVDASDTEISIGQSGPTRTENIFTQVKRRVQIEPQYGSFAPGRWSNADLDPTPFEEQTWSSLNCIYLLLVQRCNHPGNLRLGSSLYSMGLSWKLCIVIITLGHFLMAIGLTLNGVVGSRFHIPFTIQSRASFGMFFSFVIVLIRMVVAAFWYGINTYTGAQCVNVILLALWPQFAQFAQVPNRLPASANITTQMMTAYIVYFLFVLPFHWIHPRKLRWFFTIKSIVCLPAIFGMLIWACVATGGAGTGNPMFRRGNTLSGSELGWAFMSGLNAMMGNYGTLAVNINDFTRYARSSRRTYVQLFVIPASFMLMAFVGLVIVGSAERVYGELQWDVLSIMTRWNGSGAARAGTVLAAGSMAMAQVGTNLGANCVSAANDLNALFPRYIDLRRGSYIVAVVGAWVLTPWNILASADALLKFMDGYAIWLAPITGWLPLLPGLIAVTTPTAVVNAGIRNIYFSRLHVRNVFEFSYDRTDKRQNQKGTSYSQEQAKATAAAGNPTGSVGPQVDKILTEAPGLIPDDHNNNGTSPATTTPGLNKLESTPWGSDK
ncbi:cytosine-purine permease [Apiospora phragmitis]|uniref:Cytosine-purine permease n=1 Tax=Apiospora phragmitis TaxID=2905665 RepID=A0ABR1SWT2_9PEZI